MAWAAKQAQQRRVITCRSAPSEREAMSPDRAHIRSAAQRANPNLPGSLRATLICFLVAVIALASTHPLSAETATYRLEIDNSWSQQTHPGKMPPERAHFSWLGDCDSLKEVKGIGIRYDGKPILTEPEQVVPQERMDIDLPGYAWDLLPYREKQPSTSPTTTAPASATRSTQSTSCVSRAI
jgi:hypothetical protein